MLSLPNKGTSNIVKVCTKTKERTNKNNSGKKTRPVEKTSNGAGHLSRLTGHYYPEFYKNFEEHFCLLYLILYVPVNIFLVLSGQVFLGGTSTKQRIKCLAQ